MRNGHREGRRREGTILAKDVGRGGREQDVDPRVLPSAATEGESVLLVAAPAPPSRRRKDAPIAGPLPKTLELMLGHQIFIPKEALIPALRNGLTRLAAFQNPEFYKAEAMRLSTYDKPRIIACAEDHPQHIGLPRGCLDDLLQPPIFLSQLPQPPCLTHFQTLMLRLPLVISLAADPALAAISAVFMPASACSDTPIICSSVNRICRISSFSSGCYTWENPHSGWDSFRQARSRLPR